MKTPIDWGAWVSMAAIGAVSLVVALHEVPAETFEVPAPAAEPAPARAPAKAPRGSGYRVNHPDRTFELDLALNEISGLALAQDGKSLWAVHDEKPTLFRISMTDGAVLQQVDLGKRGDFESVEAVGDLVYVGRSDGVVLVVDPSGDKPIEKLTFSRELGVACDLESMAFDPRGERLLLACKNESLKSRKKGKTYEIFQLDLERKKVKHDPAFVIEASDLDALGVKGKAFAPSGLAVHPKTGELYLLSSRGKMLVVLSPEGVPLRAEPLDPQVHRQPEGIAFDRDGTMFVSEEAHGHRAKLHVIAP